MGNGEIKVYQANYCFTDFNIKTNIYSDLSELKTITEIYKGRKDYVCHEIYEIIIKIKNGKIVEPFGIIYSVIGGGNIND